MSQHDLNIANQTAALARADINSAYAALATNSSGASAPSTTYANQWWYDSSAAILKIRNNADSAWLDVGIFSGGTFVPSPGLASEAEATAGTNNTKLMTPLRTKNAAFPAFSASANGFIKLGGSITIQWGTNTVASSGLYTVTYPTAFSTAVYCITGASPSSITTTTFQYSVTSHGDEGEFSPITINWIAIGS
tara:strand:+ start:660 stop:1238 length:579 start_codon:yes stop_codon:yes gene_type:complete